MLRPALLLLVRALGLPDAEATAVQCAIESLCHYVHSYITPEYDRTHSLLLIVTTIFILILIVI